MRIEEAISQPVFKSPHHRAQINILYTAAWLNNLFIKDLRPFDITIQQFNILRILRGRPNEPSTIKLLTERMLDKNSNTSRLVDKLVAKNLVNREQSAEDRRRVDIVITSQGLLLLEKASLVMEKNTAACFSSLSPEDSDHLSNLLDKLRSSSK